MIVSQLLVAVGLLGLSVSVSTHGLAAVGVLALVVAFASSTQDIVVDAWRIEAASDSDELGLLSAAYQLGYRAALLVTDALILISASHLGWSISYSMMAALMGVGICASLVAIEPARDAPPGDPGARRRLGTSADLRMRSIGPFSEFFRVYGWLALLMLAMISLYRLPEFVMGPMANPYYHDLGLTKDAVGAVRGRSGSSGRCWASRRRPERRPLRLRPDADRRVCSSRASGPRRSRCSPPPAPICACSAA